MQNQKKYLFMTPVKMLPFTACQGMPGDILKLAGGISIFDDIEEGWATPSWEEVIERIIRK